MNSRIDAVLLPHAAGLLSEPLGEAFVELRRGLAEAREAIGRSRPGLVVVTCSELLSPGPFRLLAGRSFSGNLRGGSVPDSPYDFPGVDNDTVRSLVRRLRLAGIDSEPAFYEPLDFASAAALRHLFPAEAPPVLPVAVPTGSLRAGFRFGSVLAELLLDRELAPLWVAAGSLSHRSSKEPESVREEGELFDRELLEALAAGEIDPLVDLSARTLAAVGADAGLVHLASLIGFVGQGFRARVLAYGGIFGAGNAVATFRTGGRRTTQELAVAGAGSGESPA